MGLPLISYRQIYRYVYVYIYMEVHTDNSNLTLGLQLLIFLVGEDTGWFLGTWQGPITLSPKQGHLLLITH